MRWNGMTKRQKRDRDTSGVRSFAFLPTQMNDGTWVWLEFYWQAHHGQFDGQNLWVRALDRQDCVCKEPEA